MQIEIITDALCKQMRVVIYTDEVNDEVNELVKRLSDDAPKVLAGFRDNSFELLDLSEIIRVFASSGKVFAVTRDGEYSLRLRLYEIGERLKKSDFVRISNSEIINLRKVKSFDLSFTGTICVTFSDSSKSYVSRRYVSEIKKVLGI
ncbi:MAG: LytTR family transcriptional regulator [Clostridiaceae bacterium]|jgi:DNA-binding LytR/AlgR family response regulator|nr:LytTR family transcriptional regulator [Clostridiaceae bacterium]